MGFHRGGRGAKKITWNWGFCFAGVLGATRPRTHHAGDDDGHNLKRSKGGNTGGENLNTLKEFM